MVKFAGKVSRNQKADKLRILLISVISNAWQFTDKIWSAIAAFSGNYAKYRPVGKRAAFPVAKAWFSGAGSVSVLMRLHIKNLINGTICACVNYGGAGSQAHCPCGASREGAMRNQEEE